MTDPGYVSIGPVAWVLDEAPGLPPQLIAVLVCLARHAEADGSNAYPSHEKLALCSRKSVRQVIRDLKALEDLKLIERGDQDRVQYLPADKRPVVWNLATWRQRGDVDDTPLRAARARGGKSGVTSTSGRGVTSTSERGDVHVTDGVSSTSPKEINEEPLKNPVEEISAVPGRQPDASPAAAPLGDVLKSVTGKRDLSARLAEMSRPRGRQRGRDPLPPPRGQPPSCDFEEGSTPGYCAACEMPQGHARHTRR